MTVMTRMASIQVTSMVELRQAQSQASEAELFRLRSLCGCPADPVSMLKTHATDNPSTHHGNELDEFGRLVGRAVSRLQLRFLGMLWVLVTSYNDSPLWLFPLRCVAPCHVAALSDFTSLKEEHIMSSLGGAPPVLTIIYNHLLCHYLTLYFIHPKLKSPKLLQVVFGGCDVNHPQKP